jgi:hypothetical protein
MENNSIFKFLLSRVKNLRKILLRKRQNNRKEEVELNKKKEDYFKKN